MAAVRLRERSRLPEGPRAPACTFRAGSSSVGSSTVMAIFLLMTDCSGLDVGVKPADLEQGNGEGKGEMRGSLHCGGKCTASGRDDGVRGGRRRADAMRIPIRRFRLRRNDGFYGVRRQAQKQIPSENDKPRVGCAGYFLVKTSPMRRIWAPTPRSFSSKCS
jgi:hypothetical protein